MQVHIFLSNDFPEGNAKNTRLKAYGKGLFNKGYKVKFWVGFSSVLNQSKVNTHTSGIWQGIPFQFLSGKINYKPHILHKMWIWLHTQWNSLRVIRKLKATDTFIFYSPNFHGLILPFIYCSILGKKPVAIQTEEFTLLKQQRALKKIEAHLISKFATQIWVVTQGIKDFYINQKKAKNVSLIQACVVDLSRFTSIQLRHKPLSVGYIGTYSERDGIDLLIGAFKKVAVPGLRLNLMGQVPPHIIEKLRAYNISFTTHGYIMYDKLPEALAQNDLLIVNRRKTTFAQFGFPIKLGEYLATGVAVALVNFPEYHQYLNNEEVIYFEPDSEVALQNAIEKRYNAYDHFTALGKKGQEKCAEIFSSEKAADEIEYLISNP